MNLLQGPGAGAHLLLSRATGGLAHHAALADEDNVTVRELLLKLASKTSLNLVESLELRNGHEDDLCSVETRRDVTSTTMTQ